MAVSSTSSASIEPPSGSGAFHVSPTAFLSTVPESERPSLRPPHGSDDGVGDGAGERDRRAVALDHEDAVDRDGVAVARERAGLEGQLGVVGDVEEVRRREVRRQVGVVDVDARRLCDAADALLVEGRLELAERALERRDAHVEDGEAHGRVGRVGHPASPSRPASR